VLPKAELGDYLGLEVARRDPDVRDEQIEQEIEAMRERLARLETAERPAARGDFVVVDYVGSLVGEASDGDSRPEPFAGGEGRDQLVELGSGNLIPGFEQALLGSSAGETRTIEVPFPSDYANEELAGREGSFDVTIKEVKLKQLPAVDDDFAVDAGFDDVQELREDIRRRLLEVEEARIESEFRQAALDAAVSRARVAVTPELVKARAQEMWERLLHSLSHRGITRDAYVRVLGRAEEEILADMEADAEQALRREAVLTAVVEAERIEPTEQELLDALTPVAERESVEPQKLLEELRRRGGLEEVREDLAVRDAIELIAARAVPIPAAQARAREQLWTPEKAAESGAGGDAAGAASGRLWTPADQRSTS
jgi:trigger factor